MKSLKVMWEDLCVKMKALGMGDEETEEAEFIGELVNRVHAIEVHLGIVPAAGLAPNQEYATRPDLARIYPQAADLARVDTPADPAADPVLTPDLSANAPSHS